MYEIIPAEVFRAGGAALTYASDLELQPGHLVLIPLGKKLTIGIVVKKTTKKLDQKFKVKTVERILHPLPLPVHLIKAIKWLSEYYVSPLPLCANLVIPSNLTSRNVKKELESQVLAIETNSESPKINFPEIPLNSAQKDVLKSLQANDNTTTLLRGITGSGKTNIYLKLAESAYRNQKSTILLVPEIALTSQLVAIFSETFGENVLLIHSNQTMAERRKTWLKIIDLTSKNEPIIIIGPRSALLAPVHNLGQIIIDEAHETAYFQENPPRYSALRLASFVASTLKISCLLGSATPNITDYYLAETKNSLITLTEKAKKTAIAPELKIIDFKTRSNFTKNRYFSNELITEIKNNLKDHHQTLIFHNRRGSAPLTICESCGWQALCPNCYLPMTLHTDSYTLNCHICGYSEKVPSSCPNCKSAGIIHKGFGTKLLESELNQLFPEAKIARFDGDNKKEEDLASQYQLVKDGDIDILIGTQTLARGLDLPQLATVGIVQADAGLALPDFAAEERTFELLTQVIGRVGRGHLDRANVIIQTFQPDHPVIKTALTADYEAFAKYLLASRKKAKLPPFMHLAKLSVTYKTERTTISKIQQAYQKLLQNKQLVVTPPQPAFHEHTPRGYTWQLVIKSKTRSALTNSLVEFQQNGFTLTLDPPSLL